MKPFQDFQGRIQNSGEMKNIPLTGKYSEADRHESSALFVSSDHMIQEDMRRPDKRAGSHPEHQKASGHKIMI